MCASNRPVDTRASEARQPCDFLGVTPNLPAVQKMYEDGDAAFLAGVGNLVGLFLT